MEAEPRTTYAPITFFLKDSDPIGAERSLASARLSGARGPYRVALGAQLALLGAAVARPGLARYYVLVTWATVPALAGYLRRGVPAVWEQAPGSR